MSVASTDWDLLSSYAGLLSLACASIYAGSYGSLSSKSFKRPGTEPDEEDEQEVERLSSQDAYLFPVFGSVVLFGLYLIVKYYGKEWITWLLQWYFTIAGVGSVGKSLISLTRWLVGESRWKKFDNNKILVLKGPRELLSFSLRTPSLFLVPIGAIPSILYTFGGSVTRRSALLTDILGLSFSHNALSLLKLDSFKTGVVLLSGLFVYDIWWVFGTEVMVKVATNLDVPIKLLWPKSVLFSAERGFTMLGLGDIVIPGMFVATALRYDYHRASRQGQLASVRKAYFHAALVAYALGLVATMSVMHFFRKAQPALLYLSPACILSFFVMALFQGDLNEAWGWSDQVEEKPEQRSDKSAAGSIDKNAPVDAAAKSPVGDEPLSEDATALSSLPEESAEGSERKKQSEKKRS
ncbi:signal peptide peptidase-domain-containing protein [Dichomitus squalens]|uniref:Signal peptide peptidase-domain-containing protein n=1 Tax=Dichomitus squalens TaxID=114155 RepID=A0A4V2K1R0_9APHY|nr:signal peptide peptidase-domain-containing protein [Dichomitus squalens]